MTHCIAFAIASSSRCISTKPQRSIVLSVCDKIAGRTPAELRELAQ
jgi:hypothetical protein